MDRPQKSRFPNLEGARGNYQDWIGKKGNKRKDRRARTTISQERNRRVRGSSENAKGIRNHCNEGLSIMYETVSHAENQSIRGEHGRTWGDP